MEYLKKYNISQEEIEELKEYFNEGIIDFMKTQREFIAEKCEYLLNKNFLLYPILKNNIKIFLETIIPLKIKVKKMENKGYSKKTIQMILINEELYDKI